MKPYRVNDNFIARRSSMMLSPAYLGLSPVARLILDRLEIEYLRSGGRENGKIICTFRDLEAHCRCSTAKVRAGINELKALGFIKVKEGVPGVKGKGRSTEFGITYLPKTGTGVLPTDEWRKFDTTQKVVRAKSSIKNRPKRTGPVSPVRDTRTVSPNRDAIGADSTSGIHREMPVKSTLHVSVQRHDLDSSKPENREGMVAEVEDWWQEAWGNRRMWAHERLQLICEAVDEAA